MTPTLAYVDPTNVANAPGDGPLRAGGVSVPAIPTTQDNLPSTLSPAAERQQGALQLVRDVWGGTQTLRQKAQAYLPQAPGEDPKNYASRLTRSVFFNVFKHTVKGQIGFVFRKDPSLGDDVAAPIKVHAENIDLAGTHFDVFARDIATDAQTAGHAAILVDFPDTTGLDVPRMPNGMPTRELDLMVRPYWIAIKKDNILSWRTINENGRTVLTQLVLRECGTVDVGLFGQKEREQYRVLSRAVVDEVPLASWVLLEIVDKKFVVEVGRGIYANQTEIPVSEIPSSGRTALFESDPPLLDLAYLNLSHYQTRSDYATSIHKTCVPIWVESGTDMDSETGKATAITLGPNSARTFTNPAAKAGYQSHSGEALGQVKQALDDLIRDMAALGLAALASQKRAAETAAAKQIDKDASDSELSVTARGLQDGLERALGFHANYLQLKRAGPGKEIGGSVVVNRDFEDMTMRPEMLVAYVTAVSKAGLPVRILLEAMQQGGLIGPDEILEELELEMEANAQAIADVEAQALKDAAALKQQGAPAAA